MYSHLFPLKYCKATFYVSVEPTLDFIFHLVLYEQRKIYFMVDILSWLKMMSHYLLSEVANCLPKFGMADKGLTVKLNFYKLHYQCK